jgi:hypothetical protein
MPCHPSTRDESGKNTVLSAKKNMLRILKLLKHRMNQQKRKTDQTLQYGQSMAVV